MTAVRCCIIIGAVICRFLRRLYRPSLKVLHFCCCPFHLQVFTATRELLQVPAMPMKCCRGRKGLPSSDLDNQEMSLFWAENWQFYLYSYLALYCHAQTPPPMCWGAYATTFGLTPWAVGGIACTLHAGTKLCLGHCAHLLSLQSLSGLLIKQSFQFPPLCFIPAWFSCHGIPWTGFGDS